MRVIEKLPVEAWAERDAERTRILVRVGGSEPFEVLSYPNDAVVVDGQLKAESPYLGYLKG